MEILEEYELQPVSELVGGLADFVGQIGGPEEGAVITVTHLYIQLPLELQVAVDDENTLTLLAGAPERTETSFMAALNSLRMRVVLDDGQ